MSVVSMDEVLDQALLSSDTRPIVSVIIPTYNHARFLPSALDSVIGQTFTSWEVIVVNNFSQDNTVELVESYRDPRIQLANFANHGVIAASRNHGMALTQAPFIAFLDSDDHWYPQKLQKCLDKLSEGYDLVCHAERWVGPGNRTRDVFYGPEARASYDQLLYEGNCLSTSAVVVKRSFVEQIGGFDMASEFITAEDYEFWLKLARVGARNGFVSDILGEYLIHDGNQSGAVLRNMEAVRAVIRHHFAMLSESERRPWRERRRLAIATYGGARGLQDSGQHGAAWQYFLEALRQYPFFPKTYLAMALNAVRKRP